jgi:uncharacterized protein (DUF2267 family)
VAEFLDAIREADGKLSGYDFGNNTHAVRAVKAVFSSMASFISPGEMKDVLDSLPHEIRGILHESVFAKKISENNS